MWWFSCLFVLLLGFIHVAALPSVTSLSIRTDSNGTSNSSQPRFGLAPVTSSSDRQSYYVVVQLGVVSYRVSIDTGSSDLWITSSGCTTESCQSVPKLPLAYESGTFQTVNGNNTVFNVSYSDGTAATGFVAKEEMTLANLTVSGQAFGVITDSNVSLTNSASGVLGLGFPRLSSIPDSITNSTPFFVGLAQQGILEYPLFGISISQSTGSLAIGGVDASVISNLSEIFWNKVVEFSPFTIESNASSYLQWAVNLDSIWYNETEITPTPTYPNNTGNASIALIDIGAAGIYGPYTDVEKLFSLIDGSRLVSSSGLWGVPCDTLDIMSFTIGGQNYTLQPSDYIIGVAGGSPNLCLSWPQALAPSSDGIDWQLGVPFLQTVYSVFSYGINDREPPMIGFYSLNNSTNATESYEELSSILSSLSATIATTFPNSLIATPAYTTPAYAFNTSFNAPTGGVVSSELATSTYKPVFGSSKTNISAIPLITPTPTVVTLVVTSNGLTLTTTSTSNLEATQSLGIVPGGWSNSGPKIAAPFRSIIILLATILFVSFSRTFL